MKKTVLLLTTLTLVLASCGGGSSSCSAIVDDGMELFQDAIDQLDGLSLSELENADPFSDSEYEQQAEELEQRTTESGCTDEEMTELFADKIGTLEAADSNPAGQFFLTFLAGAAEERAFDFGG